MFTKAKFIWLKDSEYDVNEYGDFYDSFSLEDKDAKIYIASLSDYELFINDNLVSFGQYPNFKDEFYYDELDISEYVKKGNNTLKIIALSKNYDSSCHIKIGKGLIYEVVSNSGVVLYSSENTLSNINPNYKSGSIPLITSQLGMGYEYDFNDRRVKKDKSLIVDYNVKLTKRPIKKLDTSEKQYFSHVKNNIYGYKEETVGYLFFNIYVEKDTDLEIAYGEHISDGCVRSKIGGRDFTLRFHLKEGENIFFSPFLRLGLKYLELNKDVTVREIGIYHAFYPYEKSDLGESLIPKSILDKSLYTVVCCKHEHYEDCPWREQSQYTMDSRTQALVDYIGFNEKDFPRASLKMMSHTLSEKNTLMLTSPSDTFLSIPNFSLIYPLMIEEYVKFTNDKSIIEEVYQNTRTVIDHYASLFDGFLIPHIDEWNFYEWSDGLDNSLEMLERKQSENFYDFNSNAFFVLGLTSFINISKVINKPYKDYLPLIDIVKKNLLSFYRDDIFYSYLKDNELYGRHEYTNYIALYISLLDGKKEKELLSFLTNDNNLIELTISNHIFKYEVLLRHKEYIDYVVKDVKDKWGYMDSCGATTYFETILGEKDFDGAGSLCHGWSSVPVYVHYLLKKLTN